MIQAENLFFSYSGSPPYILNGVNLTIHDGEYVSILGENGCGKSTLMKLILKFLKPTRGSISSSASKVGYVPQRNEFLNSGFPITVYEAMNSYRHLLHLKDRDMINRALTMVGMTQYRSVLMGTLSGGQSQKILIARALLGTPDLLLLDEPSTGVDIGSQKDIYGFLKKINRENKITIVSIEHNLDAAIANSTLIYHLSDGRGHLCTPEKYAGEFLKNEWRMTDNA